MSGSLREPKLTMDLHVPDVERGVIDHADEPVHPGPVRVILARGVRQAGEIRLILAGQPLSEAGEPILEHPVDLGSRSGRAELLLAGATWRRITIDLLEDAPRPGGGDMDRQGAERVHRAASARVRRGFPRIEVVIRN